VQPPAQPPARQIVGLTTCFRQAQDRLHIAAKDDLGEVTGLWLTRRLADRLVRKLTARLEGVSQVAKAQAQSRAAVHVWQQSVAQARQAPAKPMPDPLPARQALIESVDIAQVDHRLKLVFHCTGVAPLALTVDGMQLRQWLGVVYRNYRLGEWTTEGVWPAWFAEAAKESAAPSGSGLILH
jgi:hypothetical protein